jgi:LMBR1 domain-containing protein 1
MADWFLILTIVIAVFLLLVMGLYFLVYYQHPDDKNDAYLPKITVILGFVFAWATVLMLPLDVANNEGYSGCDGYDTKVCGGLNMELFWDIIYWTLPVFVFFLIPFMTFYYEADDGMLMAGTSIETNSNSRICEAVKYETAVIVIFGAIFATCFLLFGDSYVPVREYEGTYISVARTTDVGEPFTTSLLGDMDGSDLAYLRGVEANATMTDIVIPVSISSFFAGFMAFLGWIFFAVFGGIGMASLPLDLLLTFTRRPRHMDAVEFAEAQVNIRERVNELVDVGELIKIEREESRVAASGGMFSRFSRDAREERNTLLEFKKAVYLLEEDVNDFKACTTEYKNHNPLIPWFALFFGIIAFTMSILWVIQIAIAILPANALHPFLNDYLRWFENWFPLFGVLTVAAFSFYLLMCAVKGCFKFGLRFLFFQLHPMQVGKTYMSSFMFNVGLILLCALPVVQFTTTAFEDYARYTTVSQVMGIQVKHMKFFRWFWENNLFIYILLCITGLTTLYLIFCTKEDPAKSSINLRDRLRKRR